MVSLFNRNKSSNVTPLPNAANNPSDFQATTSNTTNATLTNAHNNQANQDHTGRTSKMMFQRGGGTAGGRGSNGRHFQPSHVFRHPFFLITYIVAWPAWLTAFIGQCVAEGQLSEWMLSERRVGG
jgi:hypothetical protein